MVPESLSSLSFNQFHEAGSGYTKEAGMESEINYRTLGSTNNNNAIVQGDRGEQVQFPLPAGMVLDVCAVTRCLVTPLWRHFVVVFL